MSTIHTEPSELAGQTVTVNMVRDGRVPFRVEDWWDRVSGQSWMDSTGNPAAINYAVDSAILSLPVDNEVLYGKVGHLGYLVHVDQIVPAAEGAPSA